MGNSMYLFAGRQFSHNIIPYFCQKLGKMLQNLSSAAVVIGTLRVNICHQECRGSVVECLT